MSLDAILRATSFPISLRDVFHMFHHTHLLMDSSHAHPCMCIPLHYISYAFLAQTSLLHPFKRICQMHCLCRCLNAVLTAMSIDAFFTASHRLTCISYSYIPFIHICFCNAFLSFASVQSPDIAYLTNLLNALLTGTCNDVFFTIACLEEACL
jgi:hypothetical protein